MIPRTYRVLLRERGARQLLLGLGFSSLGDGMSTVTIAWLAVETAPTGALGLYVGLAVAAYTLPGAVGALVLGRYLRHRPARTLVLAHCLLRAGFLGAIAVLALGDTLTPATLPSVLATRSAVLIVASPLGTAIGGPIVNNIGAGWTLTACGAVTVLLAGIATPIWRGRRDHESVSSPQGIRP